MSALPSHEIEKFLRMFLNLPPGAFLMGNDRPVTEWDGTVRAEHQRNGPERMVSIERPFAIMSAPVSVAAFLAVKHDAMMATPVFRLPDSGIVDAPWPTVPFALANRNPACPVVGVTVVLATHDASLYLLPGQERRLLLKQIAPIGLIDPTVLLNAAPTDVGRVLIKAQTRAGLVESYATIVSP